MAQGSHTFRNIGLCVFIVTWSCCFCNMTIYAKISQHTIPPLALHQERATIMVTLISLVL
ncbi:hypothetical protein HanIR_Chr17g0886031 [Helianthus annuus]|nr:hypothetical protein HanIR_Chr17g0886031 [Helianthus annuus]